MCHFCIYVQLFVVIRVLNELVNLLTYCSSVNITQGQRRQQKNSNDDKRMAGWLVGNGDVDINADRKLKCAKTATN